MTATGPPVSDCPWSSHACIWGGCSVPRQCSSPWVRTDETAQKLRHSEHKCPPLPRKRKTTPGRRYTRTSAERRPASTCHWSLANRRRLRANRRRLSANRRHFKRRPPSIECQTPSVKRQPPSVKSQPPSVERQLLSVESQTPSVEWQPPSVKRTLPPTTSGRP